MRIFLRQLFMRLLHLNRAFHRNFTWNSVSRCLSLVIIFSLEHAHADADIWSEGYAVPAEGRGNVYGLSGDDLNLMNHAGRSHALHYPVQVTGLQIPLQTLERLFAPGIKNPLLAFLQIVLKTTDNFGSRDDLEEWLGLFPYPSEEGSGVFQVPFPESGRPNVRMGATEFLSPVASGQKALTYSCAVCHTSRFFGHVIIGMTNRFPRANDFFLMGRAAATSLPEVAIHPAFGVSRGDVPIVKRLRQRSFAIDGVSPLRIGLDTSLAHVGLSLSKRGADPYATLNPKDQQAPRDNILQRQRADSKPAVWWNLKYKNRWLSDGSVVSGNPIFTNILWNELGRGTDLHDLERWFSENAQSVDELTVAVFASESVHWTQIFENRGLDLNAARRGQTVYSSFCARCHGTFRKGWEENKYASQDLNRLSLPQVVEASRNVSFN